LASENGKARRGWRGLALAERADFGNLKNESMKSGA
jgi:hypothetical protein